MSDEDDDLLSRTRDDPAAYGEFYRRTVHLVQAFGARRLTDPHAVADFVATVFVTALEAAHRYDRGRGGAVPWLYGVAGKVMAEQRRRTAREYGAVARLSGHRHLTADDIADLEGQIDAARAVGPVLDALAALPEPDRRLMELVTVDGLPVQDAARSLGMRPATARMRLFRARRRLGPAVTGPAATGPDTSAAATSEVAGPRPAAPAGAGPRPAAPGAGPAGPARSGPVVPDRAVLLRIVPGAPAPRPRPRTAAPALGTVPPATHRC